MSSNSNIVIEHAVITFRNFKGAKKGKFGKEGDRYFSVYLDGFDRKGHMFEDQNRIPRYKYGSDWLSPNDLIPALEKDNWPVTWTKPSEDGEYPARPVLKIKLNYYNTSNPNKPRRGPNVFTTSKDGTLTTIDEDSISQLDTIWIDDAKVRVRPYNWEEERDGVENGRISAQLQDLCIVPVEDANDDDDFYDEYKKNPDEEMPW